MGGHEGAQAHKTHKRLTHILNNISHIRLLANDKEIVVLDSIQALGSTKNSTIIAEHAGVHPSNVNNILRKYEHCYAVLEIPSTDTPEELEELPYTVITDPTGKEWVAYSEVKDLIHKPIATVESSEPADVLHATIVSMAYVNTVEMDVINMTIRAEENEQMISIFKKFPASTSISIASIE